MQKKYLSPNSKFFATKTDDFYEVKRTISQTVALIQPITGEISQSPTLWLYPSEIIEIAQLAITIHYEYLLNATK